MNEVCSRVFDTNVPNEVMLEVRRNMRSDGWLYKGVADETDKMGNAVMVQSYERSVP